VTSPVGPTIPDLWETPLRQNALRSDRALARVIGQDRPHRIHVVGLPFSQVSIDARYDSCPFTTKLVRFADMMHDRGHRVTTYGGDDPSVRCEHVTIQSRESQRRAYEGCDWFTDGDWSRADWTDARVWHEWNRRAADAILPGLADGDVVCLPVGQPFSELYGEVIARGMVSCVEYGVGYEAVMTPYKAWESYAWMHTITGARWGSGVGEPVGGHFDAIIPGFFDESRYVVGPHDSDFMVFIGRDAHRKGYTVARDVARETGVGLVVIGDAGDDDDRHVVRTGRVSAAVRDEIVGSAFAVIAPTLYVEPFGNSVAESLLCGTPVITTDWGAFTETVRQGRDGYRCRTMRDFREAVYQIREGDVDGADELRDAAVARFGLDAAGLAYECWFDSLDTMIEGRGFYA
jgi:glycosyltransferase involved in cell wall biosynthesis